MADRSFPSAIRHQMTMVNYRDITMSKSISKNLRLVLLLAGSLLVRPLPAEISYSVAPYSDPQKNPALTAEDIRIFSQAINRLANDRRLANHPIRRYLNDPNLNAHITFNNPTVTELGVAAIISGNTGILTHSGRDLAFYLTMFGHEFIHIDMLEKYGHLEQHVFLPIEDFAFQDLMEEVFANVLDQWIYLSYPEIPRKPDLRNWQRQNKIDDTPEAMYNDFKELYPNLSNEQIISQVCGEMLNLFFIRSTRYTSSVIPSNVHMSYRVYNSFLIPEYAAYRERGDALLRHQWNYLASMLPFSLPENYTYDYFRGRFKDDLTRWHNGGPHSLYARVNFPYEENARAELAAQKPEERRYDYLSREDEARLNRIFQEIDPSFKPVNTARTSLQRILQEVRQEEEAKKQAAAQR